MGTAVRACGVTTGRGTRLPSLPFFIATAAYALLAECASQF